MDGGYALFGNRIPLRQVGKNALIFGGALGTMGGAYQAFQNKKKRNLLKKYSSFTHFEDQLKGNKPSLPDEAKGSQKMRRAKSERAILKELEKATDAPDFEMDKEAKIRNLIKKASRV